MKFLIDAQLPRKLAIQLFNKNTKELEDAFINHHFIEISQTSLIIHS